MGHDTVMSGSAVIRLSPKGEAIMAEPVPVGLRERRRSDHQAKSKRLLGAPNRGKRPRGVTLAKFEIWDREHGAVKDRDAEQAAAGREALGATPERIAKLGEGDLTTGDKLKVQRVTDAPLDMLKHRSQLAKDGRKDAEGNRLLFEAGDRFRRHWHAAGLTGLGAMDMGRVGTGGGSAAWAMPTTEHAAQHREAVRKAIAYMGDYLAGYVVAIVAEERDLADVGRQFTGRAKQETASAIAIEVLRAGLTSLSWHWGLIRR